MAQAPRRLASQIIDKQNGDTSQTIQFYISGTDSRTVKARFTLQPHGFACTITPDTWLNAPRNTS